VRLLVEIGLVVLAAIGVAGCVGLAPGPRQTRGRRARALVPPRPDQLLALERLTLSARTSAVHVHAYLRPVLVEIASRRLAAHGHNIERMSETTGRKLLGGRLWDIVRPGRPFPEDRHGPGVTAEELGAMLDVLERL